MTSEQPKVVEIDSMPLRWGHYRVLFIASLGQICGSCISTLVGIIIPLMQLIRHPELTASQQGITASISLIGIMLGDLFWGRLSDKYGYLFFFRLCPLIICAASLLAMFSNSLALLLVGLFFMGFGIGGGYTLDSDYISEIMPTRYKQIMVGVAKASSSLGNIITALICFIAISHYPHPIVWHHLLLIITSLSLFMFLVRIHFYQSPGWLVAQGRNSEAEATAKEFLGNDVSISDIEAKRTKKDYHKITAKELFDKQNIKKVIFSSIPWACEGFGVYGIGTFLPLIIMSLGMQSKGITPINHITNSIELSVYISIFMLIGFIAGLFLVNKMNHVKIQTLGFCLCCVGLALLWVNEKTDGSIWWSVIGLMIFEFFLNSGPHLMTYIIPSQIFSVEERGSGTGVAAALGKAGAILGVFFIPILLEQGGNQLVIIVTFILQLCGAIITYTFGRSIMPSKPKDNS